MKKIKILYYSHTIDYAGTWRSHERILHNINKDLFQPYVLYRPEADNNRLNNLQNILGNQYVIPFNASSDKYGPETGYSFKNSNFKEKILEIKPDIIHFARSGYYEWPFVDRLCPIQIETNIFGFKDDSQFLDYSVSISETINKIRNKSDIVIYNPIPLPQNGDEDLKKELKIKKGTIVFGRIGRKDNFHPIALNVVKKLKDDGLNFKYIIIGACNSMINMINNLNLNDVCILINTTNDDNFIHKFHNTIDLFLHYRSDGETFGTAIAQSMMYGKPVISHYAGYNAQNEIIKDGGYVSNNENDYYTEIVKLIKDKTYYNIISKNAKKRALDFEEISIGKKFDEIYLSLYNKKIKIT